MGIFRRFGRQSPDQTELIRNQATSAPSRSPEAGTNATAAPTVPSSGWTVDMTGVAGPSINASSTPLPLPGGGISAADTSCVL